MRHIRFIIPTDIFVRFTAIDYVPTNRREPTIFIFMGLFRVYRSEPASVRFALAKRTRRQTR